MLVFFFYPQTKSKTKTKVRRLARITIDLEI